MHYTYASPGTAEYYRKTGKFADGTLVKEVFADHAQMTTGDAHWASGTKVWFVMIKDEKGRFPGNPMWGNGWGWALFKPDTPDKQVATDYKKERLFGHIPAMTTDWVYVPFPEGTVIVKELTRVLTPTLVCVATGEGESNFNQTEREMNKYAEGDEYVRVMAVDISTCRRMRSETQSSTIAGLPMARLLKWNAPLPGFGSGT